MKRGFIIMLIQNILEEYKNGESISSLSKKYNLPYRQIRKILTDNQVPIRGGRKNQTLPPEALNELKKDFIEVYTYTELSTKFRLDKVTI